jgi:hypothetical protein
MAEILVKFDEPIAAPNGSTYFAQAVGKEVEGGLWHGWLEFQAVSDGSDALASGRETTQPNRKNLEYWAQGLTRVYLEGALDRAISLAEPPVESAPTEVESSLFAGPASRSANSSSVRREATPRPILDPFEVYAQGEGILRRELNALSRDHIETIAAAYRIGLSNPAAIKAASKADLIDAIVGDVRDRQSSLPTDSGEFRADL